MYTAADAQAYRIRFNWTTATGGFFHLPMQLHVAEKSQMRNMLDTAPAWIFYPALACWSLCYGAPAGAFFKVLAVYENWVSINHYHLLLWKKYPQRSYNKFISGIWVNQIKNKPVELAEYTRDQIEHSRPTEPFPFIRMLINTLFMLLILPVMVVRGLFKGPVYVYQRAVARRHQLLSQAGSTQ